MNNPKKDIILRVLLVYVGVLLVSVFIVTKVIAIQYAASDEFSAEADVQATRTMEIQPVRGTIYSADGQVLATSDPRYEIRMDMKSVQEDVFNDKADSLALELALLFKDRNKKEYYNLITQAFREQRRYQLIQKNVSGRDYKEIKKMPILRLGQFKGGLIAIKTEKRKKPYGMLAARTIGYEREGIKPVGIEGSFSKELTGVKGLQLMRREGGRWIPVSDKYEQEPQNGYDLVSTIDVRLQDVAEYELLNQLKSQGAQHGTVILMEVNTGYIRAIANLTRNTDGSYSESYNHGIGGSTEPGSTFKLASLMVAIEDGLIQLNDSIGTNDGTYKFYNHVMRDAKEGGYGKISIEQGFAFSSNVAVSRIIHNNYSKTPEKFVEGLKRLGLADSTGINVSGEGKPFIRNSGDNGWSGISLPWMSIGYEVKLTPLQILTFYNAVANNGIKVKPQLVQEIRKGNETIKTFAPITVNPAICSKRTLTEAKKLLEAVVDYGTGKKLQAASFRIAGKTGTTQIAQDGAGYGKGAVVRHQASFVGYFPADKPMYSCIVVIAAPTKGIYGADVSGTVFKTIADKVYANSLEYHKALNDSTTKNHSFPHIKKGYAPDIQKLLTTLNLPSPASGDYDWVAMSVKDDKPIVTGVQVSKGKMPNVKGMSAKDALYLLENMGLIVSLSGSGKIVSQSLNPGTSISPDTYVELVLK
jgi:cell division protein FtsI (penicillin-binding protein 3)